MSHGHITALAIFFIIWRGMFFVTLPFGMKTQDDEGEIILGTVSSAQARPRTIRKMLINTAVVCNPEIEPGFRQL